MIYLNWLSVIAVLILFGCGSSGSGSTDDSGGFPLEETINTDKLIGTPMEGSELGDDLDPYYFLCGKYQTLSIPQFPIKVFAAFFKRKEEKVIQQAIDTVNGAAGFNLYELTDVWSDDTRLIYRTREGLGSLTVGHTSVIRSYFNNLYYADGYYADWVIGIHVQGVGWNIIAHELGHATGIVGHSLVDFENNTLETLEDCSIMESDVGCEPPVMDDFNHMILKYSEIITAHLTETGFIEYPPACNPGDNEEDIYN